MPTVDEEGCCALCGATACRMSQLRALLATSGLSVVAIGHGYGDATLADWRALERRATEAEAALAQANSLWEYWRHIDFSDSDDHWADFTNAVYAHLEGKPVPERFLRVPLGTKAVR